MPEYGGKSDPALRCNLVLTEAKPKPPMLVMRGLVPRIHVFRPRDPQAGMTGSSQTRVRLAGLIAAITALTVATDDATAEGTSCGPAIIYGDGTHVIAHTNDDVGQVYAQPCPVGEPYHLLITASQGGDSVPLPWSVGGSNVDVDVAPCSLPGGNDLPGATIVVGYQLTGPDGKTESFAQKFTLGDDKDAPALDVHSTPRKGSKVKAGDKIAVKIIADEGFGDGRGTWQTGVRTIQLLADDGKVEPDFTEPGMLPKACAAKAWKRTLETTYVVPKNPPLVVHLTAIAADFADNENFKTAAFPTSGDWYGASPAPSPARR